MEEQQTNSEEISNNDSETIEANEANNSPQNGHVIYKDVVKAMISGYGKKSNEESKNNFAELLSKYLKQAVEGNAIVNEYNILVLFDNTLMVKSDSDRIYKAITNIEEENKNKKLLLILLSRGGEPGSAYLIGKLCRDSSNGKFVVVVPRYAKSAATLLATAADEIHMGDLSELGPIDPQINKMPALGLKNSIEHIAELVQQRPGSSQMFAQYLSLTIEPIQIGYYERAAKSAEQYAEKLLNSHKETLGSEPSDIAFKLVYDYKDHGFVIDKSEAVNIFGVNTIKIKTPEYDIGNEIYNILSDFESWADMLNHNFYFIGSLDSKPELKKREIN
ncbi:hypothetical protein COT94_03940 [Candidatus Falkowbacteria bacterium CG10_big_fil_rev_8_21_14_0_10_37_14]|uniref:Serine dehydrogenase proteinase n=1 Tax=Candidatus Falkowbacteria bacterium CG10_big_fil_rev_8_21_14_0_10_37_14 TaxID=1974561 RepID=A0A2M6WSD0_9BACT|nr:hypothetical protein [Candidatus Falkowbacteria bacterium]PIT95710.1 MAG: hypothetical protein COT94_03940 [Candidatus Falkowbacteria bacterium CG10_big_fil_rev_8_21_14_0_10_37_14]